MEKHTRMKDHAVLAEKAAECADLILLHSKDRVLQVKGPFEPAHKAYMSLALAASEAIKAFIALDESLNKTPE